MKRLSLLLPLALLLPACTQSAAPDDAALPGDDVSKDARQEQLANIGEVWRATYASGDWEALRALYADDAVLMTQGNEKIVGADNIIAFLRRLIDAGAKVEFQFMPEDVVANGDVGFFTAKYRMDITMPDAAAPTIVAGRSFLVYKWQDGSWKLWRDIDNFAPDATPEDFQ